jgi:hypothetical protein
MSNLLVRRRLHCALPHPEAVVGYSRFCRENLSRQAQAAVGISYDGATRKSKSNFLRDSYARLKS